MHILTPREELQIYAEVMTIMHLTEWISQYSPQEVMRDENLELCLRESCRHFGFHCGEWSKIQGIPLSQVITEDDPLTIDPKIIVREAAKLAFCPMTNIRITNLPTTKDEPQ